MIEKKSDKFSEKYRNEGNANYSNGDHFNALISYNKVNFIIKFKILLILLISRRFVLLYRVKILH